MKICFVIENIYSTLKNNSIVDGRAIHLKNLGEGLARKGYDVSYIARDCGQSDMEIIGKFTIYKMYSKEEGIPGLRFVLTKIPKLLNALKAADADVYLFMCAESLAGIVAWFCKKNGKKFIFYGASNKDFEANSWAMNIRDYHLFKYAIKNSDLILCQNSYQTETLQKNFGRKGEILYNPMDSAEYTYNPEGNIVWVANYSEIKRPELFIELSKRISDKFVMVGGKHPNMSQKRYKQINSKATNKNIQLLGNLNFEEAEKIISDTKLLINTSESEGLSNTFLQAWRRGIPVVSFVDPDDMIKKNNLGKVVNTFDELVNAVEKLRKGISIEHSKKIKEYFDKTFSTAKIARRLDELIKDI